MAENNYNNKVYDSEESLKRSHSKWSNFKLTILNIFGLIGVNGLWISLALELNIIYIIVSIIIILLYLILINAFKR